MKYSSYLPKMFNKKSKFLKKINADISRIYQQISRNGKNTF